MLTMTSKVKTYETCLSDFGDLKFGYKISPGGCEFLLKAGKQIIFRLLLLETASAEHRSICNNGQVVQKRLTYFELFALSYFSKKK